MWTDTRSLNARICARPARLAYLVPEELSHNLLDTLVAECLSRWGGRRTPIITTNGATINPLDWAFLDSWDADIIYSYVRLTESLQDRLYYQLAPAEIRAHEGLLDHKDAQDLRPDYTGNFSFISSLSLLPFFTRRAQSQGNELPEIADKELWPNEDQDLGDSFGFVSKSHVGYSLLPYARRLSLRPKQLPSHSARQFNPNEVSYVDDAEEFVAVIAKRPSVQTLAKLADMFCPHLHHLVRGREGWNDHLTLVIGDTISDRLLFWNAQHRYPALGGIDDLPVLRLSPQRFKNGTPDWLKGWIALRNHRHLNGNGAPQTILRSCSLPKNQLDEIANNLSNGLMVMVSSEHHASPSVTSPILASRSTSRETTIAAAFPSTWARSIVSKRARARFQDNKLELPLLPPWHIDSFPASALSRGVWAADLTIDRAEDHSSFANRRHVWKFPRRLRMEPAVGFENYVSDGNLLVVPPPPRPTGDGDLVVWDCNEWARPTLTLPSDYHAFAYSIARLPYGSPKARRAAEGNSAEARFSRIGLSDKGRDLLGVFQLFGSLPEALLFLTDPFWLKVIDSLSPQEPASNPGNISNLSGKLKEWAARNPEEPLDYDRIAKRALSLAARSFASPAQQLKSAKFEKLYQWLIGDGVRDRGNEIKQDLVKSATYLRNRGFLWQGFQWTCSLCQHRNWVPLERLAPVSSCEICRTTKSSPVADSLDLRLNPFVQHAFAPSSAQGAVIWCLRQLAIRAAWSFAFAPTVNLYRLGAKEPETDLDVVAAVDGKIYLVEVKSSFAGVKPNVFAQLRRMADELRPDVVMLAVQADESESKGYAAELASCAKDLESCDVKFELLTLSQRKNHKAKSSIAMPLDRQLNWSA